MEKTLRILLLEDAASDADLVEFELIDAGFIIASKRVTNERAYLQALDDFDPSLILSDYDLPQYTGKLALIEAKKRCPDVPFILVTGALDENEALLDEIITRGAYSCVFKKSLDQLAPAVKRAFGLSGAS